MKKSLKLGLGSVVVAGAMGGNSGGGHSSIVAPASATSPARTRPMTPDDYCRERAAQSGSSFYYSFLFLTPERRRAYVAGMYGHRPPYVGTARR